MPDLLRIGLLQCGHLHPDLIPAHGDYPEVFTDLLGPEGVELTPFDATEVLPDAIDAFDGWLVSGSACSTYDDLPWIGPLEEFLRACVEGAAPMVAVCFGHQLLAQAFGGRVAKADAGWGVGAHTYQVTRPDQPWLQPPAGTVRIVASHQDQVVELPAGAEVWLATDHCPVAGFTLGPRAMTIQPHPEFTAAVSEGLTVRRRDAIGAERADEALASLAEPLDQAIVASWMAAFLRG